MVFLIFGCGKAYDGRSIARFRPMDWIFKFLDIVLHLNLYLDQFAGSYGAWIYALLFLIIFCETGLVVTPFLPGDALLFTVGTLTAGDISTKRTPSTNGTVRKRLCFHGSFR